MTADLITSHSLQTEVHETAPQHLNYVLVGWFVCFFIWDHSQVFLNQECTQDLCRTGQKHISFTFPHPTKKIPITYTFFRPIPLEFSDSKGTWVCPNSKASTLFLHSTIFRGEAAVTSGQFRSELASISAACSHTCLPIAITVFEPQGQSCFGREGSQSLPSAVRFLLGWLSPVMGFDLQLPKRNIEEPMLTEVRCADSTWHSTLRDQHWAPQQQWEEWFTDSKDAITPCTLQTPRYYV